MKKVLHIAEAAGGVERFLELFISFFDTSFEHVLVLSQNYSLDKFRSFPRVSNIVTIHMSHGLSFRDFATISKINAIIRSESPDIVYLHSTKAGFLGRIFKRYKCPTVYNPHGWAFNMKVSSIKRFAYRLMEKILAKKTRKIVCISKFERQSAINNGICKPEKLEVIYNGISKNISLGSVDLPFAKDAIIVGQAGRLCEQKGTDIFLTVAQKLLDINKNYRFLLVGDGEWRLRIEDSLREKGLRPFFHITGWVNNPLDYINRFDIACLFSRWEGFGYVIEEYKMLNKSIIASGVDAIPELVDNCVDINDIDSIVYRINEGIFAQYSSFFDIQECVQQHSALFDALIEGRL